MPKIFSEEDRENIRLHLLQNGRSMLEKKNYNSISVADLAAESGIAKGTFYNFFPSKEAFFYEVMLLIRDENRKEILQFAKNPSKEALIEMLYKRYTNTKTVYDYFEPEELKIIFRKLPGKAQDADENSMELAKNLITACGIAESVQAGVIVNLMNVAANAAANKEFLLAEYYEETIVVIAKAIADYIYGGK